MAVLERGARTPPRAFWRRGRGGQGVLVVIIVVLVWLLAEAFTAKDRIAQQLPLLSKQQPRPSSSLVPATAGRGSTPAVGVQAQSIERPKSHQGVVLESTEDALWAWSPDECDPTAKVVQNIESWPECNPPTTTCQPGCVFWASGKFSESTRAERVRLVREVRATFTDALADVKLPRRAADPPAAPLCTYQNIRRLVAVQGAEAFTGNHQVPVAGPVPDRVRARRDRVTAEHHDAIPAEAVAAMHVLRSSIRASVERRGAETAFEIVSDSDSASIIGGRVAKSLAGWLELDVDSGAVEVPPPQQNVTHRRLRIHTKTKQGGQHRCDVVEPSPTTVVAAVQYAFARRHLFSSVDEAVPVIAVAGDSPLRQLVMTLIEVMRNQPFHFDRMTHGTLRYTVTTEGDLIQFGDPNNVPERPVLVAGSATTANDMAHPTPQRAPFPFDSVFRKSARPWALIVGANYQLLGPNGRAALENDHAHQQQNPGAAASAVVNLPTRPAMEAYSEEELDRLLLKGYSRYLEHLQEDLNTLRPQMLRFVYVTPITSAFDVADQQEIAWRNDRTRAVVAGARREWSHHKGNEHCPIRLVEAHGLSGLLSKHVARRDGTHYACSLYPKAPARIEGLRRNTLSGCSGVYERAVLATVLQGFFDPGEMVNQWEV
jgi:hypothetical protein